MIVKQYGKNPVHVSYNNRYCLVLNKSQPHKNYYFFTCHLPDPHRTAKGNALLSPQFWVLVGWLQSTFSCRQTFWSLPAPPAGSLEVALVFPSSGTLRASPLLCHLLTHVSLVSSRPIPTAGQQGS